MAALFVIKVLPRELHRCSWRRVSLSRYWLQHSRRSRCTLSKRSDMSSRRVRTLFLEYFVNQHSHQFVPSSPVLPLGDPSLLFTNAGMNQFKAIFLGHDNIPSSLLNLQRAANSQKCVRVGGKHNDLDDVGKDGYHHTFFEMLGNWSFGDYFKKEACEMAWTLLTDVYGIKPQKLFVTYFGGAHELGLSADEECREIWLQIGIPPDHIIPFGLKDNFWDMGETGPCGPCTEIHYSHLDNNNIASQLVNQGSSYVIEMWNIVFMQYNRLPDGKLKLLPKSHVDTGMGLERLVAVLQNSTSNYDTDLFRPLFNVIQKETGCRPYSGVYGDNDYDGVDTAYRIISDHARMCTVSISDGLLPDEIGAGHCLRKIIRHSTQVSMKSLKSAGGLVERLVPQVVASLESAYPEISSNTTKVIEVIQQEEEMFLRLMDKGLKLFKSMTNKLVDNIFPAQDMWELYFVNGIPEDIILDLVTSKGLIPETEHFHKRKIQQKEFQKNMEMQKKFEKNRAFTNTHAQLLMDLKIPITEDSYKYDAQYSSCGEFLGVRTITSDIVALWDGSIFVNHAFPEVELSVITKETNFYSESGGQIGDVGIIASLDGARFEVKNAICVMGYVLHQGVLTAGSLRTSDRVHMSIDKDHRGGCMTNHTATHLLNAALHKLLERTEQRSSHVTSDYLRFDFLAKEALTKAQILSVEEFVRDSIINKYSVKKLVKPFVDIIKVSNVRVLPGETYADEVKVIAIVSNVNEEISRAVSLELCCGTNFLICESTLHSILDT